MTAISGKQAGRIWDSNKSKINLEQGSETKDHARALRRKTSYLGNTVENSSQSRGDIVSEKYMSKGANRDF